jgi:COMPASS component SWD3
MPSQQVVDFIHKHLKNGHLWLLELSSLINFVGATMQNLCNFATGQFLKMYTEHVNNVYILHPVCIFSYKWEVHVSGSEDKCVYIWDLQERNILHKLEGHTDIVISVSCHPTENKIASGGLENDRAVRLWVQDN